MRAPDRRCPPRSLGGECAAPQRRPLVLALRRGCGVGQRLSSRIPPGCPGAAARCRPLATQSGMQRAGGSGGLSWPDYADSEVAGICRSVTGCAVDGDGKGKGGRGAPDDATEIRGGQHVATRNRLDARGASSACGGRGALRWRPWCAPVGRSHESEFLTWYWHRRLAVALRASQEQDGTREPALSSLRAFRATRRRSVHHGSRNAARAQGNSAGHDGHRRPPAVRPTDGSQSVRRSR